MGRDGVVVGGRRAVPTGVVIITGLQDGAARDADGDAGLGFALGDGGLVDVAPDAASDGFANGRGGRAVIGGNVEEAVGGEGDGRSGGLVPYEVRVLVRRGIAADSRRLGTESQMSGGVILVVSVGVVCAVEKVGEEGFAEVIGVDRVGRAVGQVLDRPPRQSLVFASVSLPVRTT